MIVPNYIPEPLEAPGNVTELPYLTRLTFIRRVTLLMAGSIIGVAGITLLPLPRVGLSASLVFLASVLVALEIWRITTRGRPIEALVSACALPVVLASVAELIVSLADLGLPAWQVPVGAACVLAYTYLCGRDYSFVGNFLLSLIFSSVVIAAAATSMDVPPAQTSFALASNAVFIGYVLYDLASLLSRRRFHESLAAVTDLYRDIFNFFGYFVRVVRHWHKHRLWSLPNPIELPWPQKPS